MLHVLQPAIPSTAGSCRVTKCVISVRITDAVHFDDEFATRLEKGNKLVTARHVPVYNPCGYCCIAVGF